MNYVFFVEKNEDISNLSFSYFKKLYLPFLGPNALAIYSYLIDITDVKNNFKNSFNINEVQNSLLIDKNCFFETKKILEAVGLIRSFENTKLERIIIKLNSPLSFKKFMKNTFLKKELKKRIGEIGLEKLFLEFQNKKNNMDDYIETTTSYNDMFDICFKDENINVLDTAEISFDEKINIDEAISSLPSVLFIKYMSKSIATINERNMINHISSQGFSDKSINLVINYSFTKNSRLVINFVKTICNDFFERDILIFEDIKKELELAYRKTKIDDSYNFINIDLENEIKENNFISSEIEEIDIIDLIEDLKGIN